MEKKSQSNMGRGIKLISNVAKYREELLIKKDVDSFGPMDGQLPADSTEILLQKLDKMEKEGVEVSEAKESAKEEVKPEQKKWKNLNNLVKKLGGLVVQKYVENPSLVRGRKYDVRFFMLIASTKPYLVLTNPGYVRLSLEDYSTDSFGSNDK